MKQQPLGWSRRQFLVVVAVAGTSTAYILKPFTSWATEDIDPRVVAIVEATMGIDTHNHVDVPLLKYELPGPDIDLVREMRKSGLTAISMTVALDYQKLNHEGEAYERFLNAMTAMDVALQKMA